MKTTVKLAAAFAFGSVLALAGAFGADKAPEKPHLSAAVSKPLQEAQTDLNNKKYDEAMAKLKEVQAMPNKTPYDEYILNELLGPALAHANDMVGVATVFEAAFNSPYFEQAQAPNRLSVLAQVNYQIKNYDKAIDFGTRGIKVAADPAMKDKLITVVSQAYYLKPDYPGAEHFLEQTLDDQAKAGEKPPEDRIKLLLSSCLKQTATDCEAHAMERLVTAYPTPENWQNQMYLLLQAKEQTDKNLLHVYRLAFDLDVLRGHEDYTEMASLALDAGSPGEAQQALERAFAKNVYTDPASKTRAQQMLDQAKKQAASDTATLPKITSDAVAAKTGIKDVGVGLAYLGYQQYDKAVAALTDGLQKGGLKSEPEARMLLGIAQLRGGKKDDAVKTFALVKGDPTLEHLAALWIIHAQQV